MDTAGTYPTVDGGTFQRPRSRADEGITTDVDTPMIAVEPARGTDWPTDKRASVGKRCLKALPQYPHLVPVKDQGESGSGTVSTAMVQCNKRRTTTMMNINQVNDWIADAKGGEEVIYYTGELARYRERDRNLEEIANYVWKMMEKKFVSLVQRKGDKVNYNCREYHYIIQRTSNDRL